MKIVLVALYDIRSYGIRILHSILEANGFDVTSIFFNEDMQWGKYYSETELDLLVSTIKLQCPNIVGIGVRSPLFQLHKKLFHKIRQKMDTIILVGGHHATIAPEDCIEYADIVCLGEGEYPTLELCERLSNSDAINDTKNLWIKANGQVIKNDLRPLIRNLDDVPFPSYSRHNQLYIQDGRLVPDGLQYDSRTEMAIITTRGCFFNCSFCYNATLKKIYTGKGRYVRRRSVRNVIDEIMMLKRTFRRLSYIYFSDNVFTYGKTWIKEFCAVYPNEVNLPFGCFGHFAFLDPEMLRDLKNAGLRDITLGIQSGSPYISSQIYNRKESRDLIIEGCKILSGLGIDVYYDLITNNPYETHQTHEETLDLLMHLEKPYHIRNFKMKFFPKVPLTERLLKDGIISEGDIESNHERSFEEIWKEDIDLSRNKKRQELFWDCVYFMVKHGFPKWLVTKISKSRSLRRQPKILAYPLKYLPYIFVLLKKEVKLILRGDVSTAIEELIVLIRRKKKGVGWGY